MGSTAHTPWRIRGEEIGSCNCAWGCPCQFNALPTQGRCEALVAYQITEGSFGSTRLDGVRFAAIFWWPGPIHEGNGIRQLIVDASSSAEQRRALGEIASGKHGGAYFEIFAAVCPKVYETVVKPIAIEVDREARKARVEISGLGAAKIEPIRNPVTGEEHRAKIVLPTGFEYREAEMGNTVEASVHSADPLHIELANTYAQLNAFDWSNA
ncbi:MAG: DUF1326 domain-containing protein [Candidatus Binatia bacterium]